MANARDVLKEAINEMNLLAGSGGTLEELQALARLAHTAFHAGDGEVPDDEVRKNGGLHATGLSHLGL
jgi:hypothetical protein